MFLKKLFKPNDKVKHAMSKSWKNIGHTFGTIGHGIGHGLHDAGNWTVHAAEDTFNFGKDTVGSGIKWFDKKFDKVAGIFTNPTLLIVVGVVVVAIVVLK